MDLTELTNKDAPKVEMPGFFVDGTLDVALDPTFLDTFIGAWNRAGLETKISRRSVAEIDELGPTYFAHLKRAEVFLQRGETDQPGINAILAPFDSLVAFIVDDNLNILALNEATRDWFKTWSDSSRTTAEVPPDIAKPLRQALRTSAVSNDTRTSVVKLETEDRPDTSLLQIRPLGVMPGRGGSGFLVVSSQRYWRAGQDTALKDTFGLSAAECEIVRHLVQGKSIKQIAESRGTSQGTVREQVKTIFSKMQVNSQAEVIRTVLPMTDLPLASAYRDASGLPTAPVTGNWLDAEVWQPFRTLMTPDRRKLDYHIMGPVDGAPVLYSHMGYCQARWSRSMIRLAYEHGLRVICPIRAGFGYSDNLPLKADVLAATRSDTMVILEHLGISKLPYVAHGNDLVFAVDLIAAHPNVIPELIGICARPCLPGDVQLLGTGAWQRFFMSTAKFAPQLVHFGSKAAVAMGKRMGMEAMHRKLCKDSPADLALLEDDEIRPVVLNNSSMVASRDTNAAQAFAMEYIAIEQDWSDKMVAICDTPMQILLAEQDPTIDLSYIEQIREAYPWITLEVIDGTGQFLIFQRYADLIPQIAEAAWRCAGPTTPA